MKDCDICGSYGKIRLPVRERLSAVINDTSAMGKIREYPCPECGNNIPSENIKIVQAEDFISENAGDQEFIQYCKEAIAHKIGRFLFDEGMITYTKDTKDIEYSWRKSYILRGKLGVLSPRFVAKFEERVKEHQELIAKYVVEEATKSIRNWDSMTKNPIIQKEMAIRFLYEALDKITSKRS